MKRKNTFFAVVMNSKMMTAARTLLTAILLMTGLNGAWAQAYSVSDLTTAGWTKVTSTTEIVDGKFYILWDETNNLMVGMNGTTVHYQTPANPHTNANLNKVWAIEAHNSYFNFRNISAPKLLAQIEWNHGDNLNFHDQPNPNEWSDMRLEYDNNVWTIEDAKYSISATGTDGTQYTDGQVGAEPYPGFWGPENAGTYNNDQRIKGNKSTAERGTFSIYAISREDYLENYLTINPTPADISFYAAGWTNTTSHWTRDFTGFTGNYQAQRADNKNTGDYSNWGYLEAWNNGTVFTGTLTTTLTGLPDGLYDIGAYCFKETTDVVGFTANGSSVALGNADNKYQYALLNDVEIPSTGAKANKATIGLNIEGGTWIGITDIRIIYKGQNPATVADMTNLSDAISNHPLGFEDGEYAPYNNVTAVTYLEEALTVDTSNPASYTHDYITGLVSSINGATWTANNGEVNGIAYGDLSSYETINGKDYPWGWSKKNDGSRIMGGSEGTNNTGLSATTTGKAMLLKYNANYGQTTGYTLPLKANTYYKFEFLYCGWQNQPTTNVVVTNPNNVNLTILPASFKPATTDGYNDATHWYTYTCYFKTNAAGNYTIAFNKVEGGQQQIAWGDMTLFRATAAELVVKYATGQMNEKVKEAMVNAKAAYDGNATDENYMAFTATIEDAQASIAIYQKIKNYFENLSATQLGDIPSATFKAADVYKRYSNGTVNEEADPTTGTYGSLNDMVAEWRTFAANYWKTNDPSAGSDLTAFIVNQGFELDNEAVKGSPAAWTLVWGASDARLMETGEMTPKEGNWLYNLWDNSISQKRLEQTMTGLPKGHYELTAYITGFADQTTKLMGIGGASTETASQTTTGNNIAHTVTVNAYVTDDAGTLTIRIENAGSGDTKTFFKADNFHLTYKGNDFNGITLVTPTGQMNAGIKEAMLAAEAAHASNPTLDNLNARMAAYNDATASIAEYARIRTFMDKMNTANQRGDITEVQLQAMTFWTKYSDGVVKSASDPTTGTYTSLNEAVAKYRSCISTYWGTNKAVDANMTAFIVNQGFELGNPDYWSFNTGSDTGVKATDNATYEMTNSEGDILFNSWNNKVGTLYIEQALTGLPEGIYTIKAVVAGYNDASEMVLSGNVARLKFTNSEEQAVGTEQTLENVPVTSDGKLTIRMQNTGVGNTFFKIDNVRLIYQATDAATLTLPTAVTGVMRAAAENEQTAAYTAWTNGDHSVAAYTRAYAAHAEAEISHAAYLKAQAAVNRVENLLGHTNVYTYDAYVTFYNIYNTFKAPFDARTLADNLAEQMEYQIFGNGSHHQRGVPVVPFLSSAWDDAGDYTWTDYYVNTWSHENDADGSDVIPPFIEYWHAADQGSLPAKTMTATVKAIPTSLNNVRALIRVLTTNGETPTGLTLQVAPDDNSTPATNAAPSWTRIGDTDYYYTTMTLTGGKADTDSDRDGFGDLRIQFVVDGTNNVSWVTFKNVWVDFKDKNGNAVTADWPGVTTAVTEGNGKKLGFWGGEYAPYNNVRKLQALEALKAYKAAEEEKPGSVNAVLVNNALQTYKYIFDNTTGKYVPYDWKQNPGEDWSDANPNNPNALELNAVSWRTNYTKSEIIPAYNYDGDGNISYTFETIIPDGWELNGRPNAYETRLIKYGVNAKTTADGDVGLFACCDSIVVFSKFDTKYGEKLGYTMPLKPNTKYSLTFIYTNWAKDMGESLSFHENNTSIVIHRKDDPSATCTIYNTDDDDDPTNDKPLVYLSHADEGMDMGNADAREWRSVHAYFTTANTGNTGNDEYVIEFLKSIKNRQIQLAIGELYILKYRENETLHINGQSQENDKANGYANPYKIDTRLRACNVKLTRTIQKDHWNSICLPVKLPYKDMRRVFQVDGHPALDNVFIYTGTSHRGYYEVLNFTSRRGGIQAGQPVLVKPYNDEQGQDVTGNVEINNKIILRNYVVKNNEPVQKDPNNIYDFVGVYGVTKVPQEDVIIKAKKEVEESDPDKDELIKVMNEKTWLMPTRAYFHDVTVERGGAPVKGLVQLWGFSIDDVETGIIAVEPDGTMTVTSGNIYDLNGRLVRQNAKSLEGLPRGLYIVDGRKVLVR